MVIFDDDGIFCKCSAASIGFVGAGKGIAENTSCKNYFGARALALVIICKLWFGEANGANHRPSDD